jgi:hypothetical protein
MKAMRLSPKLGLAEVHHSRALYRIWVLYEWSYASQRGPDVGVTDRMAVFKAKLRAQATFLKKSISSHVDNSLRYGLRRAASERWKLASTQSRSVASNEKFSVSGLLTNYLVKVQCENL